MRRGGGRQEGERYQRGDRDAVGRMKGLEADGRGREGREMWIGSAEEGGREVRSWEGRRWEMWIGRAEQGGSGVRSWEGRGWETGWRKVEVIWRDRDGEIETLNSYLNRIFSDT
jgi:hypothetical protein